MNEDEEPAGEDHGSPLDDEREPFTGERRRDAPSTARGRDAPDRRRTVLAVIALLVSVGAGAGAAAVFRSSATDVGGSAESARRVAVEFGAAYLTFDAASVDLASEDMLALATDQFAAEFRNDRLPSVAQLFADSTTSTRAEVTEAFLGPTIDGRVRVLVLVDIDASAAEGAQRLVNLSFVIELVDVDGVWKVDGVTPFPVPEVLAPPGSTTSTSTTTASAG